MKQFGHIFSVFLVFPLIIACTSIPQNTPTEMQEFPDGTAYLGIVFNESDTEDGIGILRILPGPLRQSLINQLEFDIKQNRLISIDDKEVSAKNFKQTIASYRPGDQVVLRFKNEENSEKTELTSLSVTLSNSSNWQGPISKKRKINTTNRHTELPVTTVENKIVDFIKAETEQLKLQHEVNQLYSLLYDWQKNNTGFHSLSRVMFPFKHPEHLIELEHHTTTPLSGLDEHPEHIFIEIAKNLDLALPKHEECLPNNNWGNLLTTLNSSEDFLESAFIKLDQKKKTEIESELHHLLLEYSQLRTIGAQLEPIKSLNAINTSMQIDLHALLNSAAAFRCLINDDLYLNLSDDLKDGNIPFELRDAITGKIEAVIKHNDQWIIYGSVDDNEYDMSMVNVVYDPSGNDTYRYNKTIAFKSKLIIDKSGDDKYLSEGIGPASGWLGTSILIDHQGNDTYQGKLASNGTGVMGIGILIDYAGKDVYHGDHFSNGAGIYGAGIIMDLGDETDQYHSVTFSQGFGGPRGLGLIYENNGNELYRANGPTPSVYGTPSVFVSFSQGIGFGLRHYDSGGIGIIYDKRGSDRYEGGEFSQAGAYYWGLGIIHDDAGDDTYYGNRYSQGFGVHQATGILFDRSGNDNYWSMTAACQGAAWDVALGLLIDIQGNDTYRGDSLCQGSAAMQAMGWLIDLGGRDHYNSTATSAQGHSGNNTYHFDPDKPVYSWSVLLDTGIENDFYSNIRENNKTTSFSEINYEQPEESRIHGLFIDTREKPAIVIPVHDQKSN